MVIQGKNTTSWKGSDSFEGAHFEIKSEAKEWDTLKNWPSIRNPQFLPYAHET